MWFLRASWLSLPLALIPLVDQAAHGDLLRWIVAVALWLTWAGGLLCTLVPSTVTLTAGRMIAPLVPITAAVAGVAGATAWKVAVALALAVVTTVLWFSGEVGASFAQGSAYGDEQRFPLKAPIPFLVPMAVTWAVCAAAGVGGVLALGGKRYLIGVLGIATAAALAWFSGPRFHQLSRRWVVVVPVGVVVHDPVLLAENALFRTTQLASLRLVAPNSEALDLTGGTAGRRLEIALTELDTIVKAATKDQPRGTALHVRSVQVSPSRPGKVLHAAGRRRMPVG